MFTPNHSTLSPFENLMTSSSIDQGIHKPQAASSDDFWQLGQRHMRSDFLQNQAVRSFLSEYGLNGQLALRAPLAVAASMLEYPSLLAESRPVRIALLGAEIQDAGADGRLFGLIPKILTSTLLQLEVELVGPKLMQGLKASQIRNIDSPPAKCHRKSCGQWWASTPREHRPDIIFMFNPGLEQHASQWMKSSELPRVLASEIPVIVFSSDLDEAHRDAHILMSYGAQIVASPKLSGSPTPTSNNISLNLLDSYASATFTVSGFHKKPLNHAKVEVAKIRTLSSVIAQIFQTEGVRVQHADAFRTCYVRRNGESCAVMHIISNKYFDPATTEIFEVKEGEESNWSRTFPARNVAAILPKVTSDLARSMLAAEIYSWF